MVKRGFCILLFMCLLCFSACACFQTEQYGQHSLDDVLKQAVSAYNEAQSVTVAYTYNLKAEHGEESIMFTQGNVSCNKADGLALSGRVTQIKGGEGGTSDVYYKAGAYYSDNGSGKYYTIMDSDEMLKSFFCVKLPLPAGSEIKSFRQAKTSGGDKYIYIANGKDSAYLINDNLYGFCGLRKPMRDKTSFSDAEYSYVIDESGALKSFKVSTIVTLYETAPYYPNYQVPDNDLEKSFEISLEISIKAKDGDVEIEIPETKDFTFLG